MGAAADGYHEIHRFGGGVYKGQVKDGKYCGAGQLALKDGTVFPVLFGEAGRFSVLGGGGMGVGDAEHTANTAQVFQLQQQALSLMQDLSKARAALKIAQNEAHNERHRASNLELLVQNLREDLELNRQREEGRLKYEDLARKLQSVTKSSPSLPPSGKDFTAAYPSPAAQVFLHTPLVFTDTTSKHMNAPRWFLRYTLMQSSRHIQRAYSLDPGSLDFYAVLTLDPSTFMQS